MDMNVGRVNYSLQNTRRTGIRILGYGTVGFKDKDFKNQDSRGTINFL